MVGIPWLFRTSSVMFPLNSLDKYPNSTIRVEELSWFWIDGIKTRQLPFVQVAIAFRFGHTSAKVKLPFSDSILSNCLALSGLLLKRAKICSMSSLVCLSACISFELDTNFSRVPFLISLISWSPSVLISFIIFSIEVGFAVPIRVIFSSAKANAEIR